MTDPRNVAHDKKVIQEKKHQGVDVGAGTEHAPQPGKKPHMETVTDAAVDHGPDSDEPTDKTESGVTP